MSDDPFTWVGFGLGLALALYYLLDRLGTHPYRPVTAIARAIQTMLEGYSLVGTLKIFTFTAWRADLALSIDERAFISIRPNLMLERFALSMLP